MATIERRDLSRPTTALSREEVIRIAREINARSGIEPNPDVSHEELWARQIASGIRPEDNEASRELLEMRYGSDDSAE